ncbi:glycoside hydrolase family 43 protein [Apiospora kogelbergensis]|uniref:Endo-1,5-alpha-L-arabinanase A n=1 Tax=Apiospora kogelbergensis TaxID=1337665 RepID=A0AAW0RF23_9PEZI
MRSVSLLLSAIIGSASVSLGSALPDWSRSKTFDTLQARADDYEAYFFAYFTGNSIEGEKIHFAASNGNNALDWEELNGGQPVLTSTMGTKGLRDPFVMRSVDGKTFWLIATDLSIGSGTSWGDAVRTGSRFLEIWESNDLVNWSAQRHVEVSPPTAGMTWAPEAYYDKEIGQYVVFWASALYAENDPNHTANTYHRMMYATTSDFRTFSDAKVWQDAGTSRIDTTVLKAGDVYYRFTKDEGSATGCTDIIQERSNTLLADLPAWTTVASCIGRNAGLAAIEGPTAFQSNPKDVNGQKYYLFVDEYGSGKYVPLETDDIAKPNWKVSSSHNLPKSPRHGTVMPITAAERSRLTSAFAKRTALAKREGSPVLPGLWADPNIAVFGKTYYVAGGNTFYVWKSNDLVEWTRSEKPILTLDGANGNVPWAVGNAWAPTIIERGSKYYFYFSGQNPTYNRKTIGVAVADSPEGPFTAQSTAMITNGESAKSGQAIDPGAFYDPKTKKYFIYWGNGSPIFAELADDMVSIKPETISNIAGLTDFREGPFVVYRNNLYHMTYCIDDTGSPNYRVGYATAPSATGPWTYRGLILEKDASQGILATGGSTTINVPGTDDWYIAYHRFAIPNGDGVHRETTIDRMYFDESTGFIKKVIPTLSSVPPQTVP